MSNHRRKKPARPDLRIITQKELSELAPFTAQHLLRLEKAGIL